VIVAALGAGVIIAQQVAAKVTRDALFLPNFPIGNLPTMKIWAALFSLAVLWPAARMMRTWGPARVVPVAFWASGLLHLCEWGLCAYSRRAAAVALYLHFAGFGAVLVSGFWSMVNERFDPHTAKKRMARIAGSATLGALVGGLTAAVLTEPLQMLPLLAAMHLFCAWLLHGLTPSPSRVAPAMEADRDRAGPDLSLLAKLPYLRQLALLVLLGAASANLVEYIFSDRVKQSYPVEADMQFFFAVFYTATNLISLLLQTIVTRRLLEKAGLGITAGAFPAALSAGSLGMLFWPGLAGASAARGAGLATQNSLFRSAYEPLYTPVPAAEKRSVKQIIDVGFERLGDIAGNTVCKSLLMLPAGMAGSALMAVAAITGALGAWVAVRLDRGYVSALERSLLDRSVELEAEDIGDQTTRATLTRITAVMPIGPRLSAEGGEAACPQPDPAPQPIDDLRSADPVRVRRALGRGVLEPERVPELVQLLAWDEVARDVMRALGHSGPGISGQLIDAMLDSSVTFAIRRRIPAILAAYPSPRTVTGLFAGLRDRRFEVRFRCGRALLKVIGGNPELRPPHEGVLEAVGRELDLGKHLWETHRLLDGCEEDELVGPRANRGLDHVFTLLALILPEEPLRIAFRALHTSDEVLRGTALEYLEGAVPQSLRDRLWPCLDEDRPAKRTSRSHEEILQSLLASHESIQLKLREREPRD
jgi:hypothetical protein